MKILHINVWSPWPSDSDSSVLLSMDNPRVRCSARECAGDLRLALEQCFKELEITIRTDKYDL